MKKQLRPKVTCPLCGHAVSRVTNIRGPMRWRKCGGCKMTYRTREVVALVKASTSRHGRNAVS